MLIMLASARIGCWGHIIAIKMRVVCILEPKDALVIININVLT